MELTLQSWDLSFFHLCIKFAYFKWKIDERPHAVDRTYTNGAHRRPPLGLESKLERRGNRNIKHSRFSKFFWHVCVYMQYMCGNGKTTSLTLWTYSWMMYTSFINQCVLLAVMWQWMWYTQIRSNSHYHGNPPKETSWSICSSANFELVLLHLRPAVFVNGWQNIHSDFSSNIVQYVWIEWTSLNQKQLT